MASIANSAAPSRLTTFGQGTDRDTFEPSLPAGWHYSPFLPSRPGNRRPPANPRDGGRAHHDNDEERLCLDDPCQFGRNRKILPGTSRLDVMPPTIPPRGGSHRRPTLPRSETAWTMDVCTQYAEDLRERESAPHDGCLPIGRGPPRRANPNPAAPDRALSRPAASGPTPARERASEQSGPCGSSRL